MDWTTLDKPETVPNAREMEEEGFGFVRSRIRSVDPEIFCVAVKSERYHFFPSVIWSRFAAVDVFGVRFGTRRTLQWNGIVVERSFWSKTRAIVSEQVLYWVPGDRLEQVDAASSSLVQFVPERFV
jgi:hypothetical protein